MGRLAAVPVVLVMALTTISHPAGARKYPCTYMQKLSFNQWDTLLAPMDYRTRDTGSGHILLAQGTIKPGEADRIEGVVQTLMAKPGGIREIWFDSPGGSASEGIEIGRVLRRLGVATRVKRGHMCVSACSYAFLGGVIRKVERGAWYGLHMFSRAPGTAVAIDRHMRKDRQTRRSAPSEDTINQLQTLEQDSALTAGKRYEFLLQMGVSIKLAEHAFITDHDTASCPPPRLLRQWNVSNVD